MSTNIKTWYDFVLQQMAAESYLDGIGKNGNDLTNVLMLGSNHAGYPQSNGELPLPATKILDGATRMTATQAGDFLTRYTIVSHLPNTASGFSATLMRDNQTGAYTLSMRSTEYFNQSAGGDWSRDGLSGADGEIGNEGFAFGQIASMESYYEHLQNGETYDAVQQAWVVSTDPNMIDFKSRFGVEDLGGTLNVTGYSLSGSLATLFTELHPEVTQACVYNATGLGNIATGKAYAAMVTDFRNRLDLAGINLSDPSNVNIYALPDPTDPTIKSEYQTIRDAIAAQYGGFSGTSYTQSGDASLVDSRITQLYGQGAHNDLEFVSNAGVHVPATQLFVEDLPNISGLGPIPWLDKLLGMHSDYGTTHSITLIADSLAVMSVFEKMGLNMDSTTQNGTVGLTTMYNILAAGSNQLATGLMLTDGVAEADSLEKIVIGLNKLIVGSDITLNSGTGFGQFGNITNRDEFYKALLAINGQIGNPSSLHIETLVGNNATTLLQLSTDTSQPNSAAYRYALVNGNPFVVTGLDYSTSTHPELALYDPATGTGNISTDYLKERADFIERKIYYNLHDAAYNISDSSNVPGYDINRPGTEVPGNIDIYLGNNTQWEDRATGIVLQRAGTVSDSTRRVIFGSDNPETNITGANADDALFGGGGNDLISGGQGNDYLEGNTGNDTLIGGTGTDTMIGGTGDDTYYVDSKSDVVTETSKLSSEIDTVNASITYILGANLENLTLIEPSPESGQAALAIDGTGNELFNTIIGNSADNILIGGIGNDHLIGGAGYDTYKYTNGGNNTDGFDTILDSDGSGAIYTDNAQLKGGAQYGDTRVHRDGNGHLYVNVDQGLVIDGNMLVQNYQDGQLELTMTGPAAEVNPAINGLVLNGDLAPNDIDPNRIGIQTEGDILGNITNGTAQASYEDIMGGGDGNDHIMSGAGNDDVGGGAGNDWIEGGTGSDYIGGGTGNDLIEGGSGSDIIAGESGNDRLFGENKISVDEAITQGNAVNLSGPTGTGLKGDWLAGGTGNDTLIAGADNDVLSGGGGADLIIAGAGDDYILGDTDYLPQYIYETDPRYSIGSTNWFHSNITTFDWTATPQPDGTILFQPVAVYPAGSGADVIYAGDGKDVAWGGDGNDVIFGEGGDDRLIGEAGNDILVGGANDDTLWGGADNDYLDGGDGADKLQGGIGDDMLGGGIGVGDNSYECFSFESLSVLLGVEIAAVKDNGTHYARCGVLFGRERNEAANDAGYANTFWRRVA